VGFRRLFVFGKVFVRGVVVGGGVVVAGAVAVAFADVGVFVLFASVQGLHTRDSRSSIAFRDWS
jgi:hypothetical protein